MERGRKRIDCLWLLVMTLTLLLPVIGFSQEDEFKPMQVTYEYTFWDGERGSWVRAWGYVRNGGTIRIGPEGEVSLCLKDAFEGNYRVVVTGKTDAGTPFENNETLKVYSDGGSGSCQLRASNQAGTYGPAAIEITSDSGERRRFDEVYFSMETTVDGYPYGFLHESYYRSYGNGIETEKGYVIPAEFVSEEMANAMTITSPLEGSVISACVGDRMSVSVSMPAMSGQATFELRNKETKEVIASDTRNVQDNDRCYGDLIIEKPFVSGDFYEIYVKCGDYEGLVNIALRDQDAPVEGFVLPDLFYTTDDNEKVYLSSLTPDENGALHIPQDSDGFLTLQVDENEAWKNIVFRSELTTTSLSGDKVHYVSNDRGGRWCITRVNISSEAGEYGPIHMIFKAGGQTREYDLIISAAAPAEDRYVSAGLMQGVTCAAQVTEIPQGLVITSPLDGMIFSGKEGMLLDIHGRGDGLEKSISYELKEAATGRVLVSVPEAQTNDTNFFYDLFVNSYFISGGEYELTAVSGGFSDSVRFYLRDEEMNPYQPYNTELAQMLKEYLSAMDTVEAGAEVNFEKYRFDAQGAGEGILGSFSVYQPWVEEATFRGEKEDLKASANWTIYDLYRFQVRDMAKYTDAQPVHVQVLSAAFGSAWKEIAGFRSAQGRTEADGVQYLWQPVYYKDEKGGILEDRVYLYALAAAPGADMDYLEGKIFYHAPAEYRMEKLLIADQQWVADFIRLMDAQTGFLSVKDENKKYDKLSLGTQSLDVRKIQLKLIEMGFMTASADGYYGEATREAVKAYQEAAGLEVTGVADAKTQDNLLTQKLEKELLTSWLQRHP